MTHQELFDKAQKKLGSSFRLWLCYVYGVMSSRMTASDLKGMQKYMEFYLKEKDNAKK